MKIVHAPHTILTTKAKTVDSITPKIKKLVADMIDTLASQKDPEGVGLAAPQVGESYRIFIMRPHKRSAVTICINPEIVTLETKDTLTKGKNAKLNTDKEEHSRLEGCLSIPRIWGSVERADTVEIRFQTLQGEVVEKRFGGFEATIVQHEMDHLNGVLFTARVLEQKNPLYKEVNGELERYEI